MILSFLYLRCLFHSLSAWLYALLNLHHSYSFAELRKPPTFICPRPTLVCFCTFSFSLFSLSFSPSVFFCFFFVLILLPDSDHHLLFTYILNAREVFCASFFFPTPTFSMLTDALVLEQEPHKKRDYLLSRQTGSVRTQTRPGFR